MTNGATEPTSSPTLIPTAEELYRQGLGAFRQGNYERSVSLFAEVLERAATSEVWSDWATAQRMCHRITESERGYRRALELDPENYDATANLGILLAGQGHAAEAAPVLEQAVKLSSGAERGRLIQLLQLCQKQDVRSPSYGRRVPKPSGPRTSVNGTAESAVAPMLTHARSRRHPSVAREAPKTAPPVGAAVPGWPQPGVFFRALIYAGSGYAEENWGEVLALADHFPVQLAPIGEGSDHRQLIPLASREKLQGLQRCVVDLPQSVIYQAAPAGMWDLDLYGKKRVGRTMFETDRVPHVFVDRCNALDEVWVPTTFNLETFAASGVERSKLRLVPPGVDTNLFRPGVEPLPIAKASGFRFLSIFDWQQRKGYDALLKAYLAEFKAGEDVSLILKATETNSTTSDLVAELTFLIEHVAGVRMENAAPVILVTTVVGQPDMPRLYAAADCFVLPSRGEGYGRPYLESLACQLPVIATDWGGQKDFLNHGNSYLIESKVVDVPENVDVPLFAGHRWAEPDVEHLRQLMRRVYTRRDEARAKAERGRQDMMRFHDWSVVVPSWVNEFQRVLG